MNPLKPKLLILSDLWGRQKSEWVSAYTSLLQDKFEITYYDCCELGGIDTTDYMQEKLHQQFVSGGIDRAVKQLVELEKAPLNILAFSVGGTIAWKFGLRTRLIQNLTCVSSTRLRNENQRPESNITLYFGNLDLHKPNMEWLDQMKTSHYILSEKGHDMYRETEVAKKVSTKLLKGK